MPIYQYANMTTVFLSGTRVHFLLYPRHLFRFIVLCNDAATIGNTSYRKCNRRHSLNARVTRVRRFSIFCLHLFTFRAYLSENERFACEGFTFCRKQYIFLLFNNLGVKATAFTSTGAEDCRQHDKNGGAECPSPRRCGR